MQRAVAALVAVALASVLLVAGAVGPAIAQEATSTADQEGTATPTEEQPSTDDETTADDDGTTTPDEGTATPPIDQHDDPDNTSEEGDLGSLSDWLGGHLAGRLEGGMVELSQGQYDSVEGLVGDEYESRLAQFVDVAGETNAEWDDRAASTYREVGDDQRQFTEDVQSYRETLAAFRDARQRGDEAAAREYARELANQAADIRETGGEIERGYRDIENSTDTELDDGEAAVEEILTNVTTTQDDVVETTFVGSSLSVTSNRSVAAFDRPATIEGRLVMDNRSAVANRSITIRVADATADVTTDADGEFAVIYRPVLIPSGVESVPVTYRPRAESPYLGTNATVPLSIDAVEPSVTVERAPATAAFGDRLATAATVAVDGLPVQGLTVTLSAEGRTLARTTTDEAGQASFSPALPAGIPAGERTLRVAAGRSGRAIAVGEATESIAVDSTGTNLSIATDAAGGDVVLAGTLTTTDGRPVPGRSIAVDAGPAGASVTTNESGGFVAVLDGESVAGSGGDEGTVTVSATFDAGGTNLERSRAVAEVAVPGSGSGTGTDGGIPLALVAAALGVIGLLAIVVLTSSWRGDGDSVGSHDAEGTAGEATTEPSPATATRWYEAAEEALRRGDDHSAVARAYAACYTGLRSDLGDDEPTPRELLGRARGRLDARAFEALADVTDAYERMAFAGEGSDDADAVLESARVLVEGRSRSHASNDD